MTTLEDNKSLVPLIDDLFKRCLNYRMYDSDSDKIELLYSAAKVEKSHNSLLHIIGEVETIINRYRD